MGRPTLWDRLQPVYCPSPRNHVPNRPHQQKGFRSVVAGAEMHQDATQHFILERITDDSPGRRTAKYRDGRRTDPQGACQNGIIAGAARNGVPISQRPGRLAYDHQPPFPSTEKPRRQKREPVSP